MEDNGSVWSLTVRTGDPLSSTDNNLAKIIKRIG
jgi:hypothetical protein